MMSITIARIARRVILNAAALIAMAGVASAAPVLITAPTTIGPTDLVITPTGGGAAVPLDQAEITVRGTTLTMNGRHTIQSLMIERAGSAPGIAGVLTHASNTIHDYSGGAGTDIVSGLSLTVTGDVTIQGASGGDVASRVDLIGRGFPSGTGPGTDAPTNGNGQSAGGGHGGFGGRGFNEPASSLGGPGYGDSIAPVTFGSGGGPNNANGTSLTGAGAGGGAIMLAVNGTLTLDGVITAGGTAGTASWWSSGGGAGGSIWIVTHSLAGSGSIASNGGGGNTAYGAGGGGGGRIRLDVTDSSTWLGTATAFGGSGNTGGGAGTICTNSPSGPIIVAKNDVATPSGTSTNFAAPFASLDVREHAIAFASPSSTFASVVVRSGGSLRLNPSILANSIEGQPGSSIGVASALLPAAITCTTFILADGAILTADNAGHPSSTGPGAGANSVVDAGGAGHGGIGGRGSVGGASNGLGGPSYGIFEAPSDFGSGGGASSPGGTSTAGAGAGGGVIRLIANASSINGLVTANGGSGTTSYYDSGGGSGGSVWITTNTLSGNGIVRANGGDGARNYSPNGAGGGAGGRVSVVVNGSSSFSGTLQALGGRGTISGAAGTVYTRAGSGVPQLATSSNNANPAITPLPSTAGVEVSVGSGARAMFPVGGSVTKLNVLTGGSIVTTSLVPIDLVVASDLNIEPNAIVSATASGHPAGQGPSGAPPTVGGGAGGGHGGGGGAGGRPPSFATLPFGAADNPFGFGSGGGSSSSTAQQNGGGGAGGGAIRLDVGGVLNLQGTISADGSNGAVSWWDSGGGAGGGIHIAAGSITGSGTVSARGGSGARNYFDGGGGGGGRIGIFSCSTTLPIANIIVDGGLGGNGGSFSGQPGEVGSLFFGASTVSITDHPDPVDITVGQPWTMAVVATTSQPDGVLTYQWRRRNDSGEYIPLTDGFDNRYYNVNTPELFVSSGRCAQEAFYDCIITDACGSFPSRPAFAQIVDPLPCPCPADFDGSGGVDGADIAFFFEAWEQGDMSADLDESGGIDFGDVGSFFTSFEGGC